MRSRSVWAKAQASRLVDITRKAHIEKVHAWGGEKTEAGRGKNGNNIPFATRAHTQPMRKGEAMKRGTYLRVLAIFNVEMAVTRGWNRHKEPV